MLHGIGRKTIYIGLDVDSIHQLMQGNELELKAEPEHGLPLNVVLCYGRKHAAIIKTWEESGATVTEIVEHDLEKFNA